MNRLRADALLLLTAIIWGTAFIAQKIGNEVIAPVSFVAVRFLISALILAPFALFEARRARAPLTRRDMGIAVAVGLCLGVAGIMQQIAMITASATNGGFLTALYVVLVPFTTWILVRERIRPVVLLAGLISIAGVWLLTSNGQARAFVAGDAILVVSDIFWAFFISLIAIFLSRTYRPFFLAFMQFAITAIVALPIAVIFESVTWAQLEAALPAILYVGILSGGIAFTLQIIAQRHTPAPEAALIMSLESVFAAISGAIILQERLPALAAVGCALILASVVAVEIGPALIKRRDRAPGG